MGFAGWRVLWTKSSRSEALSLLRLLPLMPCPWCWSKPTRGGEKKSRKKLCMIDCSTRHPRPRSNDDGEPGNWRRRWARVNQMKNGVCWKQVTLSVISSFAIIISYGINDSATICARRSWNRQENQSNRNFSKKQSRTWLGDESSDVWEFFHISITHNINYGTLPKGNECWDLKSRMNVRFDTETNGISIRHRETAF